MRIPNHPVNEMIQLTTGIDGVVMHILNTGRELPLARGTQGPRAIKHHIFINVRGAIGTWNGASPVFTSDWNSCIEFVIATITQIKSDVAKGKMVIGGEKWSAYA